MCLSRLPAGRRLQVTQLCHASQRLLREFSKTLMHHGSPENVFLEIPVTCVQRYIRPVGLTASCTRVRYTILPILGEQVWSRSGLRF